MIDAANTLLLRLKKGRRLRVNDYHIRLPAPPRDVSLDALGFDDRTRNALAKAGFADNPHTLGGLTVGEIFKLRGFGDSCLQAYLEAAQDWPRCDTEQKGSRAERLLERLRSRLKRGDKPDRRDLSVFLPRPPANVPLDSLGLDNRTRNALAEGGFESRPEALGELTVAESFRIRGFGVRCLRVYLEASLHWNELIPARSSVLEENAPQQLAARLESSLQETVIKNSDPRFRMSLRKLQCKDSKELIQKLQSLTRKRSRVLHLAGQFLDKVEDAQRLTLEQEAVAIRNASVGSRNERVIRSFFGFGGGGPKTLNEVAVNHGVTRERIRQICSRGAKDSDAESIFLPALRKAKAVLELRRLTASATVEHELRSQGIIELGTTINEIVKYSERIRFPLGTIEIVLGEARVAIASESADLAVAARCIAVQLIARYGATTAPRILAELEREGGSGLTVSAIDRMLALDNTICRCSSDTKWLHMFAPHDESFARRVRRVLAVSNRISIQELRQALRRDYREGPHTPPPHVLAEALSCVSGILVEGGHVWLLDTSPSVPIGGTSDEFAIVALLRQKGGVCERRILQQEALKQGISFSSFWRSLSYSTLISRFGEGVYGLVGTRLPPGLVAEIQSNRSIISGGLLDRGWTSNGEIWIAYRLSDSSLETGIVGIPAATRELINGDYQLQLAEQEQYGTLRIRDSQAWGLRPALEAAGAEAGDCMVVTFNRNNKRAILKVGDESLVDEFADVT
jgi:hypothetical protein